MEFQRSSVADHPETPKAFAFEMKVLWTLGAQLSFDAIVSGVINDGRSRDGPDAE
jgi:hypothetical protein